MKRSLRLRGARCATILLLAFPVLAARPQAQDRGRDPNSGAGHSPESYRESFEDGTWNDGLEGELGTIGRLRLTDPVTKGTRPYRVARETALAVARKALRLHAAALIIDDERRIADDPEFLARVDRLIEALEPVDERIGRGRWFEVDVRLPLRGLSGVLGMILDWGVPPTPPPDIDGASGAVTGLVIDAAALAAEPARPRLSLLPRLLDDAGRVVHSIEGADHDLARELGLVAWQRVAMGDAGPVMPPTPRAGANPIRVKAIGTAGENRVDLVIAKDDADRVLLEASRSPFLMRCLVVVVMPPPLRVTAPAPVVRPGSRPVHADPNRIHR